MQWINTLDDYVSSSLPGQGDFVTRPGLLQKVDVQGRFLPFAGNTVVFLLDEQTKHCLKTLQDELYGRAGALLAQRLDSAAFHITAHDLCSSGTHPEQLSRQMQTARDKTLPILERYRRQPPLTMQATWLFNMVNTSVVLGFRPADADSENRLSALYQALETVVPLGYALTPHVTMAYFRPGCYGQHQLAPLKEALHAVGLSVTLPMEGLVYQTFSDMNHYQTLG